ncbi:zinc finger SWIM domain-containing protein 3 isoform X2 [Hyla sarda]|nr:zinc finger SWIM domain-containing protein 3 isoform X2 [Hyla sarda]
MDLDRLVVKEECLTHNHSANTNPPQANIIHPPEMGENLPPDSEVPSEKICNEWLPQSPVKQNDPEEDRDIPSPCEPQSNEKQNDREEDRDIPSPCGFQNNVKQNDPEEDRDLLSPCEPQSNVKQNDPEEDRDIPSPCEPQSNAKQNDPEEKRDIPSPCGPQSNVKQNDPEEDRDIPSPCEPQSNVPSEQNDIGEAHSKPTSTTTEGPIPEELSTDPVSHLDAFIRDFQKAHDDSKIALTIGDQKQFEHLCFQTSSMTNWFQKFPESLLIHRVSSKHGFILYSFLVETKERMGKIVHFSFVKEDNAKNMSKMLKMLKYFNSEWIKVKVIYIGTAFEQMDILKEAFPSAQVLLSVYHTAHLIEKKVKGSAEFKYWVHSQIDKTIHHTTPEDLKFLAEKLEHRLDQELYAKLCKDWFSNELLWYMHVKKGELACCTYMDSVGLIDQTISDCLAKQSSLEEAIRVFLQSADCFNSNGLDKPKIAFPVSSHKASKAQPKITKKPRSILPPSQSYVPPKRKKGSKQPSKNTCNGFVLPPQSSVWRPIQLANKMLLSLKEYCNDIGFQLCWKEWEVVQKSTCLINVLPDFTIVQLLEETHKVSMSGHSCTCYFSKDYRLPCRHILSMLYACKKPVEENMVSVRWRKDYVKPLSDFKVYITVTTSSNYTESKAKAMARMGKIKNLAKEFYNLLTQCDGQEMQARISTLQTIVGLWRGDSSSDKLCPAQDQATELPYRWVKKEPIEGENGFGYELCRLDPKLPLN